MSDPDHTPPLYVDTSALARVLLRASDAPVVVAEMASYGALVASRLLRTELLRVALRTDSIVDAERLLNRVALIPLTDEVLGAAELLPPSTAATLDSIHLATALEVEGSTGLSGMLTFDGQLAEGAAFHGLTVLAPSA